MKRARSARCSAESIRARLLSVRRLCLALSLPFALLMAPTTALGQGAEVLLSKSRLPRVQSQQVLGVWLTNSPIPLYYDQRNIKQAVQ